MPNQIARNFVASLVLGPVITVIVISYASVIYAGMPADSLARGIGWALFGSLLFNTLFASFSSLPGVVAYPQDSPAVILGLVTAGLIGAAPPSGSGESVFATVAAAIVITALITGALFFFLGTFKLGNLVRYLPYPVVGGFLAGTGTLMVQGAVRSMTNISVSLESLPLLASPELLAQWLPGLILGLILLIALRRYDHFLLLPSLLIIAIGLFYVANWGAGISIGDMRLRGWLLGPFPEGTLFQPPTPEMLNKVDWQMLWTHTGTLVTVPLICSVAFLLNISGLEVVRQRDVNINLELRLAGLVNVLAGLVGGHVGYTGMSMSTLAHRMGVAARTTNFFIAIVVGLALFLGASLLSYLPKLVLGGLVFYLGFSFLATWLYDAWSRMSITDYLVIWSIVIAINGLGVMAGVGLGIALAVALFVVEYSRIRVVKHSLSGASYRSTVDRPILHQQILRRKGDEYHVFELQGFIFFGRSNQLLEEVRKRINDPDQPALRFALLDFRQVTGVDASALLSFSKMQQIASARGIVLLFTTVLDADVAQLRRDVLTDNEAHTWRIFPDLDHGVEWCEEQILEDHTAEWGKVQHAVAQLAHLLDEPNLAIVKDPEPQPDEPTTETTSSNLEKAERLLARMERRELDVGQYVIRQGEAPSGVTFVESGQLTAQLELPDGRVARLRTMQSGVFIGELSLYTASAASASVVVDRPSVVYSLSAVELAELADTDPELAAAFHQMIARLVSERLVSATDTLGSLMR